MSDQTHWVRRWIFDSYDVSAEGLASYRITFSVFTLLFLTPGHNPYFDFSPVATFSDVYYLPPPGVMQLFDGFPGPLFFEVLHAAIILAFTAILFGYRTQWSSISASVLMLIGFGFFYSLGKINHNFLFVLLPFVMSFSNWGAAWSVDALQGRTPSSPRSWPIVLMTMILGFAMFTAGLPKILGGWLDLSTQGAQSRFIRGFYASGRQDLLAPYFLQLQSDWIWELQDWATVFFEVGFLFAILNRVTTRIFAGLAILFHTGVSMVMNIAFLSNFIIYAAVLPWSDIASWCSPAVQSIRGVLSEVAPGMRTGLSTGAIVSVCACFTYAGSPLLYLDFGLTSDLLPVDVIGVGIGLLVVLFYAMRTALRSTSGAEAAY